MNRVKNDEKSHLGLPNYRAHDEAAIFNRLIRIIAFGKPLAGTVCVAVSY